MTNTTNQWKRGGKAEWCAAYERLCKGSIGEPWIAVALRRMAAGEPEEDVLADYGYFLGQG